MKNEHIEAYINRAPRGAICDDFLSEIKAAGYDTDMVKGCLTRVQGMEWLCDTRANYPDDFPSAFLLKNVFGTDCNIDRRGKERHIPTRLCIGKRLHDEVETGARMITLIDCDGEITINQMCQILVAGTTNVKIHLGEGDFFVYVYRFNSNAGVLTERKQYKRFKFIKQYKEEKRY